MALDSLTVNLKVLCSTREESKEIKVIVTSPISSVEQTLGKLFYTSSSGWGLYQTMNNPSGRERWLDSRQSISWYLPIDGTLEWKERGRVAELVFLNGTRTRIKVDDSHTVGRILQTVGSKLGLPTSAIWEYGLKFGGQLSAGLTDKDKLTSGWLDPARTLQDQGVTCANKLELRWLKRWFLFDHGLGSADEVAMHYSFLECKNQFLGDALDTTSSSVAEIARCIASLLHVDHGKFDKKKHTQQWYSNKKYAPESWAEMVNWTAVAAAWKGLGDDPSAKKTFIDMCRKFPGFACTFFDCTMGSSLQKVQVALSKEAITVYHPWSAGRSRVPTRDRRLSRSALSLSPRGPGAEEYDSATGSPSMSSKGSMGRARFGSMRRSTRSSTKPRLPGIDWEGSNIEDEGSSAPGTPKKDESPRVSPMPAPIPATGSSSPSSGAPTVEDKQPAVGGGGAGAPIKSPRGILGRKFTLRRDRKGTSSPDMSEHVAGSPGQAGATGTIGKNPSGRFKSFAGLRDLGLMKNRKSDFHSDRNSGLDGSPSGVASSPGDAPDAGLEGPDTELVPEGRKEIMTVNLENVEKWAMRGFFVVLDICKSFEETASIELNFASPEAASDFSTLLKGYCSFRIEDSPASSGALIAERWAAGSSGVGHVGIFGLRPLGVQLVGEVFARVLHAFKSKARSLELNQELEALENVVKLIMVASSTGGVTLASRAHQLVDQLSVKDDTEDFRVHLLALETALSCAFPQETEDQADDQSPCVVLEAVRNHTLMAGLVFSALSSAMRHLELDSSLLENLTDSLVFTLEEAIRHPLSMDVHIALVRRILVLAPSFAECIRSNRRQVGQSAASDALRTCATYCRDMLSDLLTVCDPVNRHLLGAGPADQLVRNLWEVESALRSFNGVARVDVVVRTVAAARDLVAQDKWEAIGPRVDSLMRVVGDLTLVGDARRNNGAGSAARVRRAVQLLSDVVSQLVSFVSDAYLGHAYSKKPEDGQPSRAISLHRVKINSLLEQAVREVLAGSFWDKSRSCIARIEKAMAALPVQDDARNEKDGWEGLWKEQAGELAVRFKQFKKNLRASQTPQQFSISVAEGLSTLLVELLAQVRDLIQPFFVPDASAAYRTSATNIIRSMETLGGQVQLLFDSVGRAAWMEFSVEEFEELVAAGTEAVDACITSLNYNNPQLAGIRQGGWATPTGKEAGSKSKSGWQRRGEISQQGAELKMKLTRKKTTVKGVRGGKDVSSPVSGSPQAASSSSPESPASLRSSGTRRLSSPPQKQKRSSGEWEDE